MAGTIVTERVAGINGGFPAEIDGSLKVRYVAPLLVNMSDRDVGLLKALGGVEQFDFDNTKIEWTEDDLWNRRLSHGGLAAGSTTSLTVTGAAHRYPIGTILFNVQDSEYVRVTGHVDANTLTIMRDITATVAEGSWANTDEVFVAGVAMDENDDYVFRPTSIFSQPYNVPQLFQSGVQSSYRRQETRIYGLSGSDLDKQAADMVAEMFVDMEMAAIHGYRFAGTSSVPSMMGGIKFYVTSTNGAQVTDLSSAPLTRKDIDDDLQDFLYAVGGSKIPNTLLVDAWGKRKISSFFSGAERKESQSGGAGGIVVTELYTDFGTVNLMLSTELAKGEMMWINTDMIEIGHHGSYGRPHLEMLPPSNVGPRSQKAFYADLSMMVKGVQGMGRIHTFSLTA